MGRLILFATPAFIALLAFLAFVLNKRIKNRRKEMSQLRTHNVALQSENTELRKFLTSLRTTAELYRGDREVQQILTQLDASTLFTNEGTDR